MLIKDYYQFRLGSAKHFLPLLADCVQAGFPSPADDHIDKKLDLNELIITHPAATFFMRVQGDSMIDAGIRSEDLLVVNRAITPTNNAIVVAIVNNELTVKRVSQQKDQLFLISENDAFEPILITEDTDFSIWGVVTHIIHKAL